MSVKKAVKGALQGVFKGEPQGAIKEMIQGANQDALQHVLSRLFQGALKRELHSKMTLKGMKEDLKTNISSILVFEIDPPVKRNKELKSISCTP